jgi:hypothetical protein
LGRATAGVCMVVPFVETPGRSARSRSPSVAVTSGWAWALCTRRVAAVLQIAARGGDGATALERLTRRRQRRRTVAMRRGSTIVDEPRENRWEMRSS